MRRLPVYFIFDTSGSMKGESSASVKVAVETLLANFKTDDYALSTVSISCITYNHNSQCILPLTGLSSFSLPDISIEKSSPALACTALKVLEQSIKDNLHFRDFGLDGDLSPVAVFFTDSDPNDCKAFKQQYMHLEQNYAVEFIFLLYEKGLRQDDIKSLCSKIYSLDTFDAALAGSILSWRDPPKSLIVPNKKRVELNKTSFNAVRPSDDQEKDSILPPPPEDNNSII